MIINTCAKRGKGKRKVDIGIRDFYEHYCNREELKYRKPKSYELYSTIIKEANQMIQDSIVKENEPVKLPYRMGVIGILKYRVKFDIEKKNFWKVDYKRSKEEGMIIYYDQEFRYKWKWAKKNVAVRGQRSYMFHPNRPASRAITQALKENKKLDYYEKLV